MAEALWWLVGWDLVDYCIIIQWAHDSTDNSPTDNFDTARCLQLWRDVDSIYFWLLLEAGKAVRRVVKSSQVNGRFMRGNWPVTRWMTGQLKAHRSEFCHRLSTGEPGWSRVRFGELPSSHICKLLAVNAAISDLKSAILKFALKQYCREYGNPINCTVHAAVKYTIRSANTADSLQPI